MEKTEGFIYRVVALELAHPVSLLVQPLQVAGVSSLQLPKTLDFVRQELLDAASCQMLQVGNELRFDFAFTRGFLESRCQAFPASHIGICDCPKKADFRGGQFDAFTSPTVSSSVSRGMPAAPGSRWPLALSSGSLELDAMRGLAAAGESSPFLRELPQEHRGSER